MRHDRDMTTAEALKAMQIIHKDSKDAQSLEHYVENRLKLYSMSKEFMTNRSDENALRELANLVKILGPDDITLDDANDPYATMEGLNQPKDKDYVIGTVADFMVDELDKYMPKARQSDDAAVSLVQHIEKITQAFDLEEIVSSFVPEVQADLISGLNALGKTGGAYIAFKSQSLTDRVVGIIDKTGGDSKMIIEDALKKDYFAAAPVPETNAPATASAHAL